MDAFLSKEALQMLLALSLISSTSNSDGLLIGHKRGHRFFVEKIFSSSKGFFPSLKKYYSLNQAFDKKILGFYSFQTDDKKVKKILAPFAYGKLFLQININKQKKMAFKSYIIDYEKEFFLSPIQLKSNK
ncbi:MAG: hypothetical protein E3J76_00410 [Candidatus Aminicenantes bacterium]|nr:MAG: hypothetical protein E3J76_00410 [Candidatus Aminicenantes bacterium]